MAVLTLQDVDLVAVLLAAVANMALGFLWYHPKVFGTTWLELIGKRPEELGNPGPGYAFSTLGSLVSALALAVVLVAFGATHWVDALGVGALVGVGFIVPVLGTQAVFNGVPVALYLLNAAYHVVAFILMALVLALWPF